MPQIPASLRIRCSYMELYPSDIEGMAIVHGVNMENAGKCRARQDGILTVIERLEDKYRDE